MGRTFDLPPRSPGKLNLIVAPTGSVASIKIPLLLTRLRETGRFNIVLLPSRTARQFYPAADIPKDVTVITDADESPSHREGRWQVGDEILHIELRRWCDVLLIAPLSAHTLAAIAAGLCDSLLLEVVRAWDYSSCLLLTDDKVGRKEKKKMVMCPAMNTAMFEHPLTARHLDTLEHLLGFHRLGPVEKTLACGDTGNGAMSSVDDIVKHLLTYTEE